ncbi:hypothetical protein TBS_33840 [Thermobispora bispora]|jgi:hypothetical protein|uniref:Uncharacterized protein n=1 Tax=Thermobispora bispora (strain ATCC 19993 / DSM 43833 / CBS 139.67 / JCM 10125 / KCTC 9307 / NBRC 14880 / R51) TaxID=469371 RepID=D6Y5F3_THEBD|nr:hypothetical protein [Thermobispora bispora]MBO2473576.1 hypothetical protein [Actinomycetales bacterium]MDI9579820.1 hypothetical protein [Thermobispora sp.]ADG89348.1 hypothetical protein Tbis_2647 [Thermobispora bispora DSM 43833]MBX6169075.1 hypothetical protein [Thermobispora bispora]QSI49008.1 hypothetical protein CYL17_15020 [Thermobispora bispora]
MMRYLVNGALGGALATAVYNAMAIAGDRASMLRRAGRPRRRTAAEEDALDAIIQYAFGAGSGALLGLLSAGRRLPLPVGAAYGIAVWLAALRRRVTGIGAFPAAPDGPGRLALPLAGHLLWGTALTIALNRLRPAGPYGHDR